MGNNNLRELGAGGNDLAGHESRESLVKSCVYCKVSTYRRNVRYWDVA